MKKTSGFCFIALSVLIGGPLQAAEESWHFKGDSGICLASYKVLDDAGERVAKLLLVKIDSSFKRLVGKSVYPYFTTTRLVVESLPFDAERGVDAMITSSSLSEPLFYTPVKEKKRNALYISGLWRHEDIALSLLAGEPLQLSFHGDDYHTISGPVQNNGFTEAYADFLECEQKLTP